MKIILLLLAVKSTLFWMYVVQLKEYRFDRFRAEYGSVRTIVKFWISGGGRKLYAPVWTVKAILIFLVSSIPVIMLAAPAAYGSFSLSYYFFFYILAPLSVIVAVFLFGAPTHFVRRHVHRLAEEKISRARGLTVIGITGSYGKSSTKEFLSQLLSKKFKVAKTPGNVNTEIGIAQFVLKTLKPDDEIFIVEMGAYKPGEIQKICEMVKPKIGILTGISEQHVALFGSFRALQKAKYELIDCLPADGLAVFNGENEYCVELSKKWKGNKIMYRHAHDLRPDLPAHYGLNLGGAIEAAKYVGMTDREIEEAIGKIRLVERMMQGFAGRHGAWMINDTYSANPDGVFAAITYLSLQPHQNKIVVMPCLIELGDASVGIHTKIGELLHKNCDCAIITTPAYFKAIHDAAGDKAVLETNPEKVVELLEQKINPETAVLLEGRLPERIIQSLR
ncbi:MAG: UDP-N-acetylmuramoyl-tripeptide--D-alanyl-D-alanine ligase [Candidatus Sungbacteria bacterium]|nr:UDP-N-acetylmuramoyl-tripeptide--D-alanyl-D-alanine ligase [Candidatus Sungbacteria bacterium]